MFMKVQLHYTVDKNYMYLVAVSIQCEYYGKQRTYRCLAL